MCIAIYKPANLEISREVLQQCFNSNPDGAGFVYVKDKQLVMEKGFFTFDSFYEAYSQVMQYQALIHFRIKTHGKVDEVNCHPFMVNDKFAFIHNGTISGHGNTEFSDTYMFNEEVLKPMVSAYGIKALFKPFIKTLLEDYIGWSKLAFLDSRGNFIIMNESKGEWNEGVWYSNSSYKPKQTYNYGYLDKPNTSYLPPITAKDTTKHQTWYLKRANGFHIYEADYCTMIGRYLSLVKDDLVEVVEINEWGYCKVKDTVTGRIITGVPGNLLSYYQYN